MRRILLSVVGLLVGFSPPGLGTVAPGVGDAFELIPGVIVDPASATVFMMSPSGGIDRVSVRSGELLWSAAPLHAGHRDRWRYLDALPHRDPAALPATL